MTVPKDFKIPPLDPEIAPSYANAVLKSTPLNVLNIVKMAMNAHKEPNLWRHPIRWIKWKLNPPRDIKLYGIQELPLPKNPYFIKFKLRKGNSQSSRYLAWRVRRVLIDIQNNDSEWAKVVGAYREHSRYSMFHRVVVVIGFGHSYGFGEYIDAVEMGSADTTPGQLIQWHREEFESRFRRLEPQPKNWEEAEKRWND